MSDNLADDGAKNCTVSHVEAQTGETATILELPAKIRTTRFSHVLRLYLAGVLWAILAALAALSRGPYSWAFIVAGVLAYFALSTPLWSSVTVTEDKLVVRNGFRVINVKNGNIARLVVTEGNTVGRYVMIRRKRGRPVRALGLACDRYEISPQIQLIADAIKVELVEA